MKNALLYKPKYIEMRLADFARKFPDLAMSIAECTGGLIDFCDPHYLVRIRENKIEIGYGSDAWKID